MAQSDEDHEPVLLMAQVCMTDEVGDDLVPAVYLNEEKVVPCTPLPASGTRTLGPQAT